MPNPKLSPSPKVKQRTAKVKGPMDFPLFQVPEFIQLMDFLLNHGNNSN